MVNEKGEADGFRKIASGDDFDGLGRWGGGRVQYGRWVWSRCAKGWREDSISVSLAPVTLDDRAPYSLCPVGLTVSMAAAYSQGLDRQDQLADMLAAFHQTMGFGGLCQGESGVQGGLEATSRNQWPNVGVQGLGDGAFERHGARA